MQALRLLSLAERIRYLVDLARTHSVNREFRRLHPEIQFPPTWIAYDAYRSCGYDRYYNKGLQVATEVYRIYDALLPRTAEPETRILEWGCGPGRVIQRLPTWTPRADCVSSDVTTRRIQSGGAGRRSSSASSP